MAYVLRSPHAHARIRSIDMRAAQQMPGVLAVFTGADWAAEKFGACSAGHSAPAPRRLADVSCRCARRSPRTAPCWSAIPVAFIVAESVDLAKDAAERIVVDYEALPSVDRDRRSDGARRAGAVGRMPPTTNASSSRSATRRAVDAAFAKAHHVTRLKLVFNRITAATMEPRGCVGEYDDRLDRYTLYVRHAAPARHARRHGAPGRLQHAREPVRIVAGDVGGSFGMKGGHFPEYPLALCAVAQDRPPGQMDRRAQRRHPVATTTTATMSREAELALDKDGNFLALRVKNISNIGAYLAPGGIISPTIASRRPRRHLHDAGDLCRGLGRLHQHHQHRPLSRLRPARGVLYHRAPDRQRRARDGHRPRRAAPPQHRAGRGDAVQDRPRLHARLRRVREESRHGAAHRRLRRFERRRAEAASARQAARHRHRQHHRADLADAWARR